MTGMTRLVTPTNCSVVGFGTPIGAPYRMTTQDACEKIENIVLITLLGAGIGLAAWGRPGISTGAVAGFMFSFLIYSVGRIWHRVHSHRYEVTPVSKQIVDQHSPALGKYSRADVKVIDNAAECFEIKKALLRLAKTSIEWSFNFAGGRDFREVMSIIRKRMDEHPQLRVHLILSEDLLTKQDRLLLQELERHQRFAYLITQRLYSTEPFPHSEENHVKLLLVDGQHFILGGSGVHSRMTAVDSPLGPPESDETFSAKLLHRAVRDTDLAGSGPMAETMRQQFFALYQTWENRTHNVDINRFFPLEESVSQLEQCSLPAALEGFGYIKNVKIKLFVGGPEHRLKNPITEEVAKRIRKATSEIRLASLCINPTKPIREALKGQRGRVVVIGYTGHTFPLSFASWACYNLFDKIFEHHSLGIMYHRKIDTFDGKLVVVGSYNLGAKSGDCDDEIICTMKDERVAQVVNCSLVADAADSTLQEPQHQHLSLVLKMVGSVSQYVLGRFWI